MDRALYLATLDAELRTAEGFGEERRAAELRTQIARLSAGTAANPAIEKTGRPAARKSRTT